MRWSGKRKSSRSTPSSAARIRTRITWSAAFHAPSTSTKWRRSTSERLNLVSRLISQADEFVNEVYIPDLLAVASFYKDWAKYGGGLAQLSLLRRIPDQGLQPSRGVQVCARRGAQSRSLDTCYPVNPRDSQEIKEYIAHSWYTLRRRRRRGPASMGGRDEHQLQRPEAAVRNPRRLREVFVPEDAALERQRDGSGAAGAPAGFVCGRPRGCEGSGRRGAGQAGRAGRGAVSARWAAPRRAASMRRWR